MTEFLFYLCAIVSALTACIVAIYGYISLFTPTPFSISLPTLPSWAVGTIATLCIPLAAIVAFLALPGALTIVLFLPIFALAYAIYLRGTGVTFITALLAASPWVAFSSSFTLLMTTLLGGYRSSSFDGSGLVELIIIYLVVFGLQIVTLQRTWPKTNSAISTRAWRGYHLTTFVWYGLLILTTIGSMTPN